MPTEFIERPLDRIAARSRSVLRDFLASEAAGGLILIGAAIVALIAANSPLAPRYFEWLHMETGPALSPKLGPMTVHLWINDGLMALFFFLVGLEIKRELVDGRLSTWERRRLPAIAAAAGMLTPALVYLAIAGGDPALRNGWAVPAATDIAFAIGVLALLGKRAPTSLKLFLVTVAIVDDMGAVAIIALVYTPALNTIWLLASAALLGVMYLLNRQRVMTIWPYALLALLLWYAVLMSGVHATVAGVLAALMVPVIVTPGAPDSRDSPLHRLEHLIHPWSAYLVIPLFGFANAGVPLGGLGLADVAAPVPLAIALGLFLGKQIGIFGAIWLTVRLGYANPLRGATWVQVYGVCLLCGIGFTMSLFIGELAFPGQGEAASVLRDQAKLGILAGSLLSALAGFTVLRFARPAPRAGAEERRIAREIALDGDAGSIETAGGGR